MPELIDRHALLAAYDRAHKGPPGGARKLIAEAPAIEAEPVRHGRWIKQENGMNICSVCGVTKVSHFPFCGNCGAKMDATNTNVGGKGGADSG